jgi:cell division transport system ATP-binding protein
MVAPESMTGIRSTVIDFEAASFSYGARPVLRDVSLRLEPGSMHFLTGRSGAGKTTLLRLIYGALAPRSGVVRVLGRDMGSATRRDVALLRRRLGLVLQDCDLLDHLTVHENIALPLRVGGTMASRAPADIEALAAWVGLAQRLGARPPELSTGERQRVAVARALIAAPDVVIADEPTGDVDEEAASRILDLFLELNAAGRTVLVATHDLALVRKAQGRAQARTLRLEGGTIIRAGASL